MWYGYNVWLSVKIKQVTTTFISDKVLTCMQTGKQFTIHVIYLQYCIYEQPTAKHDVCNNMVTEAHFT